MEEKGFIVIKQDRSITVPESLRKLGVKRDHNVNTLTFNCLRFWNGHDLTDLTIYINYQRSDGEKGSYIAENVRVDEEDANIIYFDWTIKGHVTKIAGNVTVSVCAKETDEEGIEIIHWNTESNKTTYVSDGLECNGEISEQYPDVINQIQDNIDALGDIMDAELEKKADKDSIPTSLPASDVPSWAKQPSPDNTLTQSGQAADAKAVGDVRGQVSELKGDLVRLENLLKQIQDKLNQGTVVDNITVNEINDMIVEYFESKTVSEVEV